MVAVKTCKARVDQSSDSTLTLKALERLLTQYPTGCWQCDLISACCQGTLLGFAHLAQPIAKGQEIAVIDPTTMTEWDMTKKCKSGTMSPLEPWPDEQNTPSTGPQSFLFWNPNATQRLIDPPPSAQLSPRMFVTSSQILGEGGWNIITSKQAAGLNPNIYYLKAEHAIWS